MLHKHWFIHSGNKAIHIREFLRSQSIYVLGFSFIMTFAIHISMSNPSATQLQHWTIRDWNCKMIFKRKKN
jgi:hypothetical protein